MDNNPQKPCEGTPVRNDEVNKCGCLIMENVHSPDETKSDRNDSTTRKRIEVEDLSGDLKELVMLIKEVLLKVPKSAKKKRRRQKAAHNMDTKLETLYHDRYGHLHGWKRTVLENAATGVDPAICDCKPSKEICYFCLAGKMQNQPYPDGDARVDAAIVTLGGSQQSSIRRAKDGRTGAW